MSAKPRKTKTELSDLRVHAIEVTNFKKIGYAKLAIGPEGATIAGDNGAGKSCFFDAIEWAFGGDQAVDNPKRLIKDGADSARVFLDAGPIRITRIRTEAGTSTKIDSLDPKAYKTTEAMLHALYSGMAFDQSAFDAMKPEKQRAMLADLVGLTDGLAALKAKEREAFQWRTENGRYLDQAEAQLARLEGLGEDVAPIDLDAVLAERDAGDRHNAKLRELEQSAQRLDGLVSQADQRINELREELNRMESKRAEVADLRKGARLALKAAGEPIDTASINERIRSAQATNATAAKQAERRKVLAEREALQSKQDRLTADVEAARKAQRDLIAAAEMPIAGLGMDDDGVTFNGKPYAEQSDGQREAIGLAILSRMDSSIRVALIRNASLMAPKRRAEAVANARAAGLQPLLELTDTSGKIGVVIDDGAIVKINPEGAIDGE